MTREEMVDLVEVEIKSLAVNFEMEDYLAAADDAERDTSFSFPTSVAFQIKWLKERIKRHLFFMLYTESAHKFKVKQISLHQRFDHYGKLIKSLDDRFEKILEEEIYQFAGVQPTQAFAHQIGPGFAYDRNTGEDITYQQTNRVPIKPSDTE